MVMVDGSEPHVNGLITFSPWGGVGVRNQSTREGGVFLMELIWNFNEWSIPTHGSYTMARRTGNHKHLLFLLSLSFQLSFRSVSATVDTKREQVGPSPLK